MGGRRSGRPGPPPTAARRPRHGSRYGRPDLVHRNHLGKSAREADPPPAIDTAARWGALEQAFAARRYDGDHPEPLPGGRLSQPAPGIVEVAATTRSGLVVTAPHATNHARSGEVKWADRGTGGLALLLAELTGCGALISVGGLAPDPGDANFEARHPFKDYLADLSPQVVVDLHGMRTRGGMDIDLGFGEGAVPEEFLASLDRSGLRVTRNALFDATRPTTVAAFTQARGIPAVQVEIGAHLRPPDGAAAAMTGLVDAIVRAIECEAVALTAARTSPTGQSPRAATHQLDTLLARIPSGVPMAVLHPDLLPDTRGPVPVMVRASGRGAVAWAWRADADGIPERLRELPPTRAGLTRMTVAALTGGSGLTAGSGVVDRAELVIPPMHRLRVVSALSDDLPGPHEVQVSPQDFAEPAAYLLARDGVVAWVTAVPKDHVRPGTVRIAHQYRLLTAVATGAEGSRERDDPQHLVLVAAPRDMIDRPSGSSRLRRAMIGVDQWIERFWRRLLRAPEFSARVVQAHAGDDGESVLSLGRGAFDRIGVEPGMQVIVRWGGREAVARAVEEHEPASGTTTARSEQRVNRLWPGTPDDLPSQNIVRMSAHLRAQLDAPVSTVVTVRRRMRTFITANLYRFALPVAGLGLAVHQINDPRWPVIGGAAAVMTVFALARLRMPKPPRHPRVDRDWVDTMAPSDDHGSPAAG